MGEEGEFKKINKPSATKKCYSPLPGTEEKPVFINENVPYFKPD